jgi:hypothetical protein
MEEEECWCCRGERLCVSCCCCGAPEAEGGMGDEKGRLVTELEGVAEEKPTPAPAPALAAVGVGGRGECALEEEEYEEWGMGDSDRGRGGGGTGCPAVDEENED